MSTAVHDLLHTLAVFLPKALAFVVILVVGWVVARLLRTVVDKVLTRMGFDRAVDRGGIRAVLARSRYDASDIVGRLVYYAVLLFTLELAFGLWGPNPVSDLIGGIVAWLPKAFVAILIIVVATAVASGVRAVVAAALGRLPYGQLLAGAAAWSIIGLGAIAALNQIGVATAVTTPVLVAVLATVAGILIVGVGGGLVRPMQVRWERWLDRVGQESRAVAEHTREYRAGRAEAVAPGAAAEAVAGPGAEAGPPGAAAPGAAAEAVAAEAAAPGAGREAVAPWVAEPDAAPTEVLPTVRDESTGVRLGSEATQVLPTVPDEPTDGTGQPSGYGVPAPRTGGDPESTQVLPPPGGHEPPTR